MKQVCSRVGLLGESGMNTNLTTSVIKRFLRNISCSFSNLDIKSKVSDSVFLSFLHLLTQKTCILEPQWDYYGKSGKAYPKSSELAIKELGY